MIQQRKKPLVFISSTIDELKDERLFFKECVNYFGFEPAMFEEWGARPSGLRQTYIDDIMEMKAKLKNDLTCWISRIVVCKTRKECL